MFPLLYTRTLTVSPETDGFPGSQSHTSAGAVLVGAEVIVGATAVGDPVGGAGVLLDGSEVEVSAGAVALAPPIVAVGAGQVDEGEAAGPVGVGPEGVEEGALVRVVVAVRVRVAVGLLVGKTRVASWVACSRATVVGALA